MRVSPLLTLEQVFAKVCQDKSLDPGRFMLQHPQDPLASIDMKATIASSKLVEINIISVGGEPYSCNTSSYISILNSLFYHSCIITFCQQK